MSIKAIIFDLDGTLIRHDEAYQSACVRSVARCSFNPLWKTKATFGAKDGWPDTLQNVYEKGLHGDIYNGTPDALCRLFDKARRGMSLGYISVDTKLLKALKQAKESGVELYVMTHSEENIALKALKKAGLGEVFGKEDVHSVSGKQWGNTYVDFLRTRIQGIYPEEVMFFDDLKRNCIAAREAGLYAVHIVKDDDETLAEMILDVVKYNQEHEQVVQAEMQTVEL